jgi:hypothetical protein
MRATLPLQQLRKLSRRAAGNLHQTLIPDLVFYFTYWRHSRNMESALLKSKRGWGSVSAYRRPECFRLGDDLPYAEILIW